MLYTALEQPRGPVAIRYPRGQGEGVQLAEPASLPWERGQLLRQGQDLLIIAAGTTAGPALKAARRLAEAGVDTAVINPRFIKPLDEELIVNWARKCRAVLTVEENVLAGGFGSSVIELLHSRECTIPVRRLGLEDRFIEQGPRGKMLSRCRLDSAGIYRTALDMIKKLKKVKGGAAVERIWAR